MDKTKKEPSPPKKSTKKTSKILTQTKNEKEICFTIMPFGGWFDIYYKNIFCPAIKKCKLEPKRADDLYRPSNIVQDIWSLTKKAKIILADLTNKNANVFYELGLAHSLAKPVVLVTQNIDDIPFDLRSLRVIEYDKNSHDWGKILQKNIESAIKETLTSPNETIPTAFLEVNVKNIKKGTKLSRYDKDILSLREDVDIIKRQLLSYSSKIKRPIPIISEKEATEMLSEMFRNKLPIHFIIRTLSDKYNIPKEWIMEKINNYRL